MSNQQYQDINEYVHVILIVDVISCNILMRIINYIGLLLDRQGIQALFRLDLQSRGKMSM